ncbi:MAG: sodium/glutamate symporter [Haemophilus parainfluenzae]
MALIHFEKSLQTSMMLVFFSSIGLSANFARLIKGGKPLVIFLLSQHTHCLPKCHRYFRYSIIRH